MAHTAHRRWSLIYSCMQNRTVLKWLSKLNNLVCYNTKRLALGADAGLRCESRPIWEVNWNANSNSEDNRTPAGSRGRKCCAPGQKGENITVKMNDKCRRSGSLLFSVTQVLMAFFFRLLFPLFKSRDSETHQRRARTRLTAPPLMFGR